MSSRLERAERAAKQKKIKPAFHRQIIIEERNKQIFALKEKLRTAMVLLRYCRPIVRSYAEASHLTTDGLGEIVNGIPTGERHRNENDAFVERLDQFLGLPPRISPRRSSDG